MDDVAFVGLFAGYDIYQRKEATDRLRDILCTLKREIWGRFGSTLRKDIPEKYVKIFLPYYKNYTYDVYETVLTAKGILAERIWKYGFAFCGKKVWIGG